MTLPLKPLYFFLQQDNGYFVDVNVHSIESKPRLLLKVFREENEFGYVNENLYIQSGQIFFNEEGTFLPPRSIHYRMKQLNETTNIYEDVWVKKFDCAVEPLFEDDIIAYFSKMFDAVYTPEVREMIAKAIEVEIAAANA